MDFHIGSGLAGLTRSANEAEDLRFFGGRYGILAEKPSPAWQFTLIDSQSSMASAKRPSASMKPR